MFLWNAILILAGKVHRARISSHCDGCIHELSHLGFYVGSNKLLVFNSKFRRGSFRIRGMRSSKRWGDEAGRHSQNTAWTFTLYWIPRVEGYQRLIRSSRWWITNSTDQCRVEVTCHPGIIRWKLPWNGRLIMTTSLSQNRRCGLFFLVGLHVHV